MKYSNFSIAVTEFLDQSNLQRRPEIELLREVILETCPNLFESIKWNGPNYSDDGKDRISMRIFPNNQLQLILHLGAKSTKSVEPSRIPDSLGLLIWKSADRALMDFPNSDRILSTKTSLAEIIQNWIQLNKEIGAE